MAKKSDSEGKPSVMQLVKAALATLGDEAKPEPIRDHILKEHQRDIPKQQISTYKSIIKKQAGGTKSKRLPREGGVPATPATPPRAQGDLVLQFVSTVRDFEAKLGSDKLLEVIDALYKQKA
jgi:hypothetical protein